MHEVSLLKVKDGWGRDPCDDSSELSPNSVFPNFNFWDKGLRPLSGLGTYGHSFSFMDAPRLCVSSISQLFIILKWIASK